MPPREKPRPVVAGLGDAPALRPVAQGTALDSFVRPGEVDLGRPTQTNQFAQLSHALSSIEPNLRQFSFEQTSRAFEEEVAQAQKAHLEQRDEWNRRIRSGQIPAGISPFFIKALQRIELKEVAREFHTTLQNSFFGADGAAARESDSPLELARLTTQVQEAFLKQRMVKDDGTPLFNALDLQEVFAPLIEQAKNQLRTTHANLRVQAREQEAEVAGGKFVTDLLDGVGLHQTQYLDDASRNGVLDSFGQSINDFFYNPDTGLVRNGMNPTKANALIVDAVVAKAVQQGNPDLLEVLNHITTKGGVLGNTKDAIAKVTTAREHIISQQIQKEHYDEWKSMQPFRMLSSLRTLETNRREDIRWEEERTRLQRQEGEFAQANLVKSYENRIFDGLRREDGQQVIDSAMRELELLDTSAAIRMKNAVSTILKSRADYDDNPLTVTQLRMDILKNPLAFDVTRLSDAVGRREMKTSTFLQLVDDLSRERAHGDDPFLRQPSFVALLNSVQTGAMKGTEGTPASAERAPIAAEAVGAFRDEALAWRAANPNGTVEQFHVYMRGKVKTVIEQADPEFRAEQETLRMRQQRKEGFTDAERRIREEHPKILERSRQEAADELSRLRNEQPKPDKEAPAAPAPSKGTTKPSEKAVKALRENPTPDNVMAFAKKFGTDAVPDDIPRAVGMTTSGRFMVDDGEIIDQKTREVITAEKFNKRATDKEKDEVERILRDAGFLDD